MFKKLISLIAVLGVVAGFTPVSPVMADSAALKADRVWHYDGYRVERLEFGIDEVDEIIKIDDYTIITVRTPGCDSECDVRDLYFLENGNYTHVEDVPGYVLDEANYFANDERFVWIELMDEDEENRYNVVEYLPESNEKIVVLEDLFFSGVESIKAIASGDEYYMNPVYNYDNHQGFKQAAVYKYYSEIGLTEIITKHWELQNEEALDAHDGMLLTKMTFDSGYSQLWLYGDGEWPYALTDTWTVPHEDIVGAHFLTDGSIEFFRMYERYVWTPGEDGGVTEAQGDYLSWSRDLDDALQIVNGRMAWIDADETLKVSTEDGVIELGAIGLTGMFRLEGDRIFYNAGDAGEVYDFANEDSETVPFAATDSAEGVVVGTDVFSNILYFEEETETELTLGYGSIPFVTDANHIYWVGNDGHVYEATISPGTTADTDEVTAAMTDWSNTVYLIDGSEYYEITSEDVYFSWFESFETVELVDDAWFDAYTYAGSARLAPGTRVKLEGDPKLYIVGDDGKLHWLISQAVAYSIYGSEWNQNVIEMNYEQLVPYSYGKTVNSEADVLEI